MVTYGAGKSRLTPFQFPNSSSRFAVLKHLEQAWCVCVFRASVAGQHEMYTVTIYRRSGSVMALWWLCSLWKGKPDLWKLVSRVNSKPALALVLVGGKWVN